MGKRRSHGTGSLYVKQGSWYGRWWIDGRRVNRKIGPVRPPGTREGLTKVQAEKAMREKIGAVTSAAPIERKTVRDAGAKMVEIMEVKGRKRNTIDAAHNALDVHIEPFFGNKPLEKIDRNMVERFIAAELDTGSSPKSVRNFLSALHSAFEVAIDRGWAQSNPVKRAVKPEVGVTTEIRFLSLEEVEAVLAATPDDERGKVEKTLYLAAAMTGLRQGELLGLRWGDVDWLAGKVRVRRAYSHGEYVTPKSRRGVRAVPLADRLATELEGLSRRSQYSTDADLVFAHPETGNPLDGSKVLKRFKAALGRAGVREVRFHDLRHTFGTQMAGAGVPMRTLQEWMGHRELRTTEIYADYFPDDKRERDLIDKAFGGSDSRIGSDLVTKFRS